MEAVGNCMSDDFLDRFVPASYPFFFQLFPHLIGYGQHNSLHTQSSTNICNLNVTRFPYEMARLATDIAGGLLGTMPSAKDLHNYAGIIWTGCNLTIYDKDNPNVGSQIVLAKNAYEVGVPSFGSCWGIQISGELRYLGTSKKTRLILNQHVWIGRLSG